MPTTRPETAKQPGDESGTLGKHQSGVPEGDINHPHAGAPEGTDNEGMLQSELGHKIGRPQGKGRGGAGG